VGEDRFKTRETVDEDVVTRGEGQQTRKIFTEEILAGEKGCVLNWSSGSVDDRHSREQVGLRIYIGSECKCIWTTMTCSSVSKCNGKKDIYNI
jgi:hypothetical protein